MTIVFYKYITYVQINLLSTIYPQTNSNIISFGRILHVLFLGLLCYEAGLSPNKKNTINDIQVFSISNRFDDCKKGQEIEKSKKYIYHYMFKYFSHEISIYLPIVTPSIKC